MKKISVILFSLFVFTSIFAIPEKPVPQRLVNDFAQVLDQQQVLELENKLRDFSNSTTTQIVIVTVNSLEGDAAWSYAQQIGEKWGVGSEGFNNGVVVLFKQKTTEEPKGDVSIQVGRGLEPVIPDAVCKRIIENEMIPKFKQNDIYGGINGAVDILMSLSLKEFTAQAYVKKTSSKGKGSIFVILIVLFIVMQIFSAAGKARRSSIGSKGLPFWMLLSMLGSGGGRSSGSFGNFSSGGSSFGGFGGGSFGGGGASGSW